MITKESIFEEFKIAKEKDIAKSKTPPPYENVFTNRIKVLESHRDAKKSHPNQYRNLDINGLPRNSIPTSDRIPGACVKRTLPQVKMPAGKTIGIAYNKGNYQVVDAADIKTMGKKI